MPDLWFEILSAAPLRDHVAPALAFELRLGNRVPNEAIQSVLLKCQIQIETARRRYSAPEQAELHELFDHPSRWGDTLRPVTWANVSTSVPGFVGNTICSVALPCTFDFSVATAKYFRGIAEGDVPLTFLFSGTVFYHNEAGSLQVAPISWNKEAKFRLPIATWKELLDLHYPNAAYLTLRRDVFDDLYRFKVRAGFATFEEAIVRMLAIAEREQAVS